MAGAGGQRGHSEVSAVQHTPGSRWLSLTQSNAPQRGGEGGEEGRRDGGRWRGRKGEEEERGGEERRGRIGTKEGIKRGEERKSNKNEITQPSLTLTNNNRVQTERGGQDVLRVRRSASGRDHTLITPVRALARGRPVWRLHASEERVYISSACLHPSTPKCLHLFMFYRFFPPLSYSLVSHTKWESFPCCFFSVVHFPSIFSSAPRRR